MRVIIAIVIWFIVSIVIYLLLFIFAGSLVQSDTECKWQYYMNTHWGVCSETKLYKLK